MHDKPFLRDTLTKPRKVGEYFNNVESKKRYLDIFLWSQIGMGADDKQRWGFQLQ